MILLIKIFNKVEYHLGNPVVSTQFISIPGDAILGWSYTNLNM